MVDEKIDIAIVGGGVSGVYCAWRLKQDDPTRKIALFEGSGRIGGRLLSVRPPGVPGMVAETNIGFWDGFRPRRHKAWQMG